MTFISYAQNFEDVMLWRALKHIDNGFYIDIGAQDPVIDSVSLAFYEHGWRGVHVEPSHQFAKKLRLARPDETVFQVAIGSSSDDLVFFEFKDTGLSTADVEIARRHIASGYSHVQTTVSVISLDILFQNFKDHDIHWLKLDVEGMEKSALESWVTSSARPWIIVVESTKPSTQELSHYEWEPLILQKNYKFVYFDGLNCFYLAIEHLDLTPAFSSPPNIFDDFLLSGQASQPFYKLVEEKLLKEKAKTQKAESKALEAKKESLLFKSKLNEIYDSRSWKITKFFRWLNVQIKLLSEDGIISRSKNLSRLFYNKLLNNIPTNTKKISYILKILKKKFNIFNIHCWKYYFICQDYSCSSKIKRFYIWNIKLFVSNRPRLKAFILKCLKPFPGLKYRLHKLNCDSSSSNNRASISRTIQLSPNSRRIYNDLKNIVKQHHSLGSSHKSVQERRSR